MNLNQYEIGWGQEKTLKFIEKQYKDGTYGVYLLGAPKVGKSQILLSFRNSLINDPACITKYFNINEFIHRENPYPEQLADEIKNFRELSPNGALQRIIIIDHIERLFNKPEYSISPRDEWGLFKDINAAALKSLRDTLVNIYNANEKKTFLVLCERIDNGNNLASSNFAVNLGLSTAYLGLLSRDEAISLISDRDLDEFDKQSILRQRGLHPQLIKEGFDNPNSLEFINFVHWILMSGNQGRTLEFLKYLMKKKSSYGEIPWIEYNRIKEDKIDDQDIYYYSQRSIIAVDYYSEMGPIIAIPSLEIRARIRNWLPEQFEFKRERWQIAAYSLIGLPITLIIILLVMAFILLLSKIFFQNNFTWILIGILFSVFPLSIFLGWIIIEKVLNQEN